MGNLRTAWVSHEFARSLKLPWIVRFEDIDKPRVVPGAIQKQLEDLKFLNLIPDQVLIQSDFHSRHESLFHKAVDSGQVYPCTCSRKEVLESLQQMASAPHATAPMAIYDGRCRDQNNRKPSNGLATLAWRFKNPENPDGSQDFIIARTDPRGGEFVPAYHWACAIDDYDGDHLLLVRASDLSQVIAQQRAIFSWVGETEATIKPYPAVFHTALVVSNDGHRLEKRTRGITLDELRDNKIDVREMIARFEKSFNRAEIKTFAPGKIWGEIPDQIRLSNLGF